MISVVCPFYNEEAILEASVNLMLQNLTTLPEPWELIIVNDGSRDGSLEIARCLEDENQALRVLSYRFNRGRGYAIRTGVAQAQGDIIVTTEIDSSWGDDIVQRIVAAFGQHPDADIVIASPHLPGGGYRNVPLIRVLLSTLGNWIIRAGLTYQVTMNTGMTRGYRREKFLRLPLDENEKEMHLEIINKALAFGYQIYEIPAILEWKTHKLTPTATKPRKSSFKLSKLVHTHMLFSLLAAPFRYIYVVSGFLAFGSMFFFGWAFYNLFRPGPSIYLALIAFFLSLFAFLTLALGILSQQGRVIMRELWWLRSELKALKFNHAGQVLADNTDSFGTRLGILDESMIYKGQKVKKIIGGNKHKYE